VFWIITQHNSRKSVSVIESETCKNKQKIYNRLYKHHVEHVIKIERDKIFKTRSLKDYFSEEILTN